MNFLSDDIKARPTFYRCAQKDSVLDDQKMVWKRDGCCDLGRNNADSVAANRIKTGGRENPKDYHRLTKLKTDLSVSICFQLFNLFAKNFVTVKKSCLPDGDCSTGLTFYARMVSDRIRPDLFLPDNRTWIVIEDEMRKLAALQLSLVSRVV